MEKQQASRQGFLYRLLFAGDIQINKRAYIWNMIASTLYSFQAAIFLLVANRVGGETDAGAFIILFTVGTTLGTLGSCCMRSFQVSDVKEEYSFVDYYTTRWTTCTLMAVVAVGYLIQKRLGWEDAVVLFCLVGYRVVEGMEDVCHGMVQRLGRFDVSSIAMAARIIIASILFCVVYILTNNRMYASIAFFTGALVVYGVFITVIRQEFADKLPRKLNFSHLWKLLYACLPLLVGGFLYTYLVNAPKYAIDAVLSKDMQTIYNILAMPAFVINILSMFIYRPLMVKISLLWNDNNRKGFVRMMLQQLAIIAGLTVVVMVGGAVIGLWLLGVIYGVDLMAWKPLFLLILFFGGVAAAACFFDLLVTVMRKQYFTIVSYGTAWVVHLLVTKRLVSAYGLWGAGYAYGVIIGTICLVDFAAVVVQIVKKGKQQ